MKSSEYRRERFDDLPYGGDAVRAAWKDTLDNVDKCETVVASDSRDVIERRTLRRSTRTSSSCMWTVQQKTVTSGRLEMGRAFSEWRNPLSVVTGLRNSTSRNQARPRTAHYEAESEESWQEL